MAVETEQPRGTISHRTRQNWLEFGLIGFAAALTYAASSSADLHERFHALLGGYERAQADELFIVILGLLTESPRVFFHAVEGGARRTGFTDRSRV